MNETNQQPTEAVEASPALPTDLARVREETTELTSRRDWRGMLL